MYQKNYEMQVILWRKHLAKMSKKNLVHIYIYTHKIPPPPA
jgi:hypothetical protein